MDKKAGQRIQRFLPIHADQATVQTGQQCGLRLPSEQRTKKSTVQRTPEKHDRKRNPGSLTNQDQQSQGKNGEYREKAQHVLSTTPWTEDVGNRRQSARNVKIYSLHVSWTTRTSLE